MLAAVKHHIAQQFPFLLEGRSLVTVSGGLDSMVLLHLCHTLSLDIAVAHCNFNLRGSESDDDTNFVTTYCDANNIPVYVKHFDTSAYAKITKTSTQIAARELRYAWFKELSDAKNFDYILTAHHLNDDLETFLINFGRGTGISGLIGIPSINEKVVRPLLKFSRKRIHTYALENKLQWREDSSNATDAYLRNDLRHNVVPALESAVPNVLVGFEKTQAHLKQSIALLKVYHSELRQQFMTEVDAMQHIHIPGVMQHQEPAAVLYALLSHYGFTAWEDIKDLLSAQSGKQVMSPTHRLVKDRDVLQLMEISEDTSTHYQWERGVSEINGDFGRLQLEVVSQMDTVQKNELYKDSSLLAFPLEIRTWKEGDYFYPIGLSGRKKLSKYFKDEKVSLIAKEKTWLLCKGEAILWVMGMRADDRFKVTESTQEIIKITLYDA